MSIGFGSYPADPEKRPKLATTVDLQSQLTAANARVEELTAERDAAVSMLAEWCIRVDINGTGWDDWDESYKDAMHRPCSIRTLLDAAIAKERLKWKEEYGRE